MVNFSEDIFYPQIQRIFGPVLPNMERYDPHQDNSAIDYYHNNYYTARIVSRHFPGIRDMEGDSVITGTNQYGYTYGREYKAHMEFMAQFDFYGPDAEENGTRALFTLRRELNIHPVDYAFGWKKTDSLTDLSELDDAKKYLVRYVSRWEFWTTYTVIEDYGNPLQVANISNIKPLTQN